MKQIRRTGLALLGLLLGAALALAEGPDDLFVQVYNLIQQADNLRASGRVQDAQAKYIAASGMLDKLQANYPSWNEKIVNYRRRYIAEQLGPNAAELLAKPATPTTAPAAATPAANPDDRVGQLNAEVNALRAERETLQAKLREALSVQPAATDPRELAKAERRLQELKGENDTLKNTLAQQQAKLAGLPDAKAFADAQKALRDAQDALQRQTKSVDSLSKERDALKEKLKRATDKNEARAAKEQEKAARTTAPAPDATKLNELESRLKEAQAALSAEKNRSDILLAEKSALEKRVNELAQAKSKPATTAAPASTPAPAPVTTAPAPAATPTAAVTPAAPAPPPTPAETKADKKAQKEAIKLLTRERDELRKRVAVLSRELEERRLNSGTAQKDRIAEELSILRTRLQVYESRQVPYTPEEMALFKQTPSVNPKGETAALRRASRQVPAGAATLVVEAQRAFQARRLDEAEKKFQQALMLDEKNLGLLTDLAATHLEQGRLDAAEAELNRAMTIDPNDPDALSLMGLLRFRQAKYDEALDILGRAVLYSPDNALTQNYLGVTLSQKGQRAPAETAFRKALQLEPNYAEAHFNLAIVYAHAKPPSIELARWHYQKALAGGQPKNPEIESIINAGSATTPAVAPATTPAGK